MDAIFDGSETSSEDEEYSLSDTNVSQRGNVKLNVGRAIQEENSVRATHNGIIAGLSTQDTTKEASQDLDWCLPATGSNHDGTSSLSRNPRSMRQERIVGDILAQDTTKEASQDRDCSLPATGSSHDETSSLSGNPRSMRQERIVGDILAQDTTKEASQDRDWCLPATGSSHDETSLERVDLDFAKRERSVDDLLGLEIDNNCVTVAAINNTYRETLPKCENPACSRQEDMSMDSSNLEVKTEKIQTSAEQFVAVEGKSSNSEEEGAVGGIELFASKPREMLQYDHDLIFQTFTEQYRKHCGAKGFISQTNKKYSMATHFKNDLKFFCTVFAICGTNVQKILRNKAPEFASLFLTRVRQYNVHTGPLKQGLKKDVLTLDRIASLAPHIVCAIFKIGKGDLIADLAPLEVPVPRAMQSTMFAGVCPQGPPTYCYYFYYQLSRKVFKTSVNLSEIVKRVDTVFQGRTNFTLTQRQNICVTLELASLDERGWGWKTEVLSVFDAAEKLWLEVNESFNREIRERDEWRDLFRDIFEMMLLNKNK